ncbi:YCF48-related protein [Bacteroidota bacterium]
MKLGIIIQNLGRAKDIVYGVGNNGLIYKWGDIDGIEYKWSPSSGLDYDSIVHPLAAPTSNTSYTLTVSSPYFETTTSEPVKVNVNYIDTEIDVYDTVSCGQPYQLDGSVGIAWAKIFDNEFVTYKVYFKDELNGFLGGSQVTHDGGKTWDHERFNYFGDYLYFQSDNIWYTTTTYLTSDPEEPNFFDIGKTINSGKKWEWQQVPHSINQIHFFNEDNGIAICDSGNIIKTTNAGKSWHEDSKISSADLNAMEFVNETTGYIVTDNGKLFKTNDAAETWNEVELGIELVLKDICFTNNQFGYIVGERGLLLTTRDGGSEWSIKIIDKRINLYDICKVTDDILYIAGSRGSIYKTIDKGHHWNKMYTGITLNSLKSIHFINEKVGFAGGNEVLLKYNEVPQTQYTWQAAPGITDIHSSMPLITVSDAQTYTTSITSVDGCGESELSYHINSIDEDFGIDDQEFEVLCGEEIILTPEVNCYHCIDLEYDWSPATGLSGTSIEGPVGNITETTTYNLKVTNPYSCEGGEETAQSSITVKVVPPEILFVNLSDDQVRLSVKGKYDSYIWSNGDTTATTTVSFGEYTAIVTAENGCTIETEIFEFKNTPDNIQKASADEILVYPNPANDKLFINYAGFNGLFFIEIYNLQGQQVLKSECNKINNEFSVSNFKQGFYIIHVISNDKKLVNKFYKQ